MATPPRAAVTHGAARQRWPVTLAIGWLLLLCFAAFATLLLPGPWLRTYIVDGDFSHQFYAFQSYAAQRLAQGQLPLWDPFVYGGQPHLADPQSALFFPVGLLVNLVAGHQGLTYVALEWRAFFDVALGALFTYLFVARLSRSVVGGIVGAVCFAFGGYLASYPLPQLPVLEASIWLPLILYGLERGLTAHRPWADGTRWWLLTGLAGALLVLAGHGQTAMLAGYAALGYALVRWATLRRPLVPTVLQALLALAVAAGLSAPQLLPTLSYLPATNRASISYAEASGGFAWRDLWQLLLPGPFFVRSLYIGILPLGCALLALRRRAAWGWALLWLLAVLLALGGHGPLYPLLYGRLPGFASFRDQERAAYLASFAAAVLAGYGAAAVLAWRARAGEETTAHRLLPVGVACAFAALALTVVGGALLRQGAPPAAVVAAAAPLALNVAAALLLAAGAALTLLTAARRWLPAGAVALLLCLLPAINVLGADGDLSRTTTNPLAPLPTEVIRYLDAQPGIWRVDTLRDHELPLNVGANIDLSFPRGDDPLVLRRAADLANQADRYKVWQLFNVRYLISHQNPGQGFQRVFAADGFDVYQMLYGLPRVWAVRDVNVVASVADARAATLALAQPGATVVLEQPPPLPIAGPSLPRDQHTDWLEEAPERLRWRETLTDNAVLVISEPLAPGWHATVDGRAAALLPADYAFMALPLPAGEHTITVQYAPPGLGLGFGLAAAAALLAVAAGAASVMAARRGRDLTPGPFPTGKGS